MQKNISENIKIKTLPKSQVEITGSISVENFNSFKSKALENINNEITIDGFRKGKVPENILTAKVGVMSILEEMAELAIARAYPEIVIGEKIDAIGRPEVRITKLAENNPLEFTIITAITPEVKLGDYKKISKEENDKPVSQIEVTDAEVEDAVKKIKESHKDHEGHDHDSPEAREQIKKYLLSDKEMQAREKKRISISDKLIETSTIDIPEILVNSELHRIESQFSSDIERMGVKLEDYLKHAKKSMEEIRAEWKPHAEKKAQLQLILNKIADEEKLSPTKEEIETEVGHIMKHYKDADKERASIYAETVLTNEKVYAFLESQK